MYERFSERAYNIMLISNRVAYDLNDDATDDEHILLGMTLEISGVAGTVLRNAGATINRIRSEIDRLVTHPSSRPTSEALPLSPRAKRVMYNAIKAAAGLGHNYIGTEHLLLGLLEVRDGLAVQVLLNLGLDLSALKNEVLLFCGSPAVVVTDDSPRCDACRFGKASELQTMPKKVILSCTRFPPKPGRVDLGIYPRVLGDWSCGEFKPKAH